MKLISLLESECNYLCVHRLASLILSKIDSNYETMDNSYNII